MGEHYSPEEIEQGLSGVDEERSKEIVRHLLSGCPQCQATVQRRRYELRKTAGSALPPDLSAAYNTVLERAEDFARRAAILPAGER
jgi:hypothetical protein